MQTVLLVAAGVVLGAIVLGLLAFGLLQRKLGVFVDTITQMIVASGIPPFRIRLDRADAPEWRDDACMADVTRQFEAVGYQRIGDFDVREMDEVRLRALWNRDSGTWVAVYDHPDGGMWVDAFQEFTDGTSVTVSTVSETGMDRPIHSKLFRVETELSDEGVARELHDTLVHESIGLEPNRFDPDDFAEVYAELYAQEMDWRIARGGVPRAEIERVAEIYGNEPPDDATIDLIQDMWRRSISCFIDEAVQDAWLVDCGLSAQEWEGLQGRMYVVHEYHGKDDLIDNLAWTMVEGDADRDADYDDEAAHEAAKETIRGCFDVSNRDGFARAQVMLPEKRRYEKLASTEDPWPADVWAEPPSED